MAQKIAHTQTEATLLSLWAKILRVDEEVLDVEEDFYAAGGDSIGAIQLALAARKAGLQILASDVVRNPTIRALARIHETSGTSRKATKATYTPAASLSKMSPADLTLLRMDLDGLKKLRDGLTGVNPGEVMDLYPATGMQASLLFASLSVSDAYIIRQGYDFPPGIETAKFIQAFQTFVDHPNGSILRTQFVWDSSSSRYLQVVLRSGCRKVPVTIIPLRDEEDLTVQIAQYQRERGSEPFPTGQLLTRICIFELNGFTRALSWSVHHSLADGWGMVNMESDIHDIYYGRSPPLRPSFKGMVQYLEGVDHTAGVEYWKKKLQGLVPTPFLQPDPGSAQLINADKTYSDELRLPESPLARQKGIIASTIVTTAWAVVLAAHSGTMDVAFGQVLTGRSIPVHDVNLMNGPCINTVPRRVSLDPSTTVLDTLRSVQRDQIEAGEYEMISLAELLAGGLPTKALIRTLLNFLNPGGMQSLESVEVKGREANIFGSYRTDEIQGVDTPFTLQVTHQSKTHFTLEIFYDPSVISESRVSTLIDHFKHAVLSIWTNFDQPISNITDKNAVAAFSLAPEKDTQKRIAQPLQEEHLAPRTATESALLSLWATILRISEDSFGIDDNFYALGGDSIGVIQLAVAARKAGMKLIATDIVRNPTIRALSRIHDSSGRNREAGTSTYTPAVSLSKMSPTDLTLLNLDYYSLKKLREGLTGMNPSEVMDLYPASGMQASLLFAGLSVSDAYIIRQGYDFPPGIETSKFIQAFQTFVDHPNGSTLRTQFVWDPSSNRYLQAILRPGCRKVPVTIIPLRDEDDFNVQIAQYQRERGSEQFPAGQLLTRIGVFELNGFARGFSWSVHHSLSDNWGLMSMESDIDDIYHGRSPPLRPSFKGMVQYLESLDRTAGVEYWKNKLQDLAPTPFLQIDPGSAHRINADKTYTDGVHLSEAPLARHHGIMASTIVTTAWAAVLAAHSGTMDIAFGQVLTGRSVPVHDVNLMNGLCINTIPRRVSLDTSATVLDTLRSVQTDQFEAGEHETISLSELLAEGLPAKALVRTLMSFINPSATRSLDSTEVKGREGSIFAFSRNDVIQGVDTPFTLSVCQMSPTHFELEVFYDPGLISEARVIKLMDHFKQTLRSISSDLDQPIRGVIYQDALTTFFLAPERDLRGVELEVQKEEHVEPRTATEGAVRALWSKILRVSEEILGIDDNFYAVGGDSIGVIQLAAAARKVGMKLIATDIFRNPTIRALAELIDRPAM